MIFTILLALPALLSVTMLVAFFVARRLEDKIIIVTFAVFAIGFGSVPALSSWANHAGDLAAISAQSHVIEVYQEQVDNLTERLDKFSYPKGALVNADTPIAAIVAALSDAERNLAESKAIRAEAILSVEARRVGPMSGVFWIAGDYK